MRKTINQVIEEGKILFNTDFAEILPDITISYDAENKPQEVLTGADYVNEFIIYYTELKSGDKYISGWLEKKLDDPSLPEKIKLLCTMLYKANWKRVADVLFNLYYTPIANVEGTEEWERKLIHEGSEDKTENTTRTNTNNIDGTVTRTGNNSQTSNKTVNNKVSAYDSNDLVNNDSSDQNGTITDDIDETETDKTTNTQNGTDNTTGNTTNNSTDTETYKLTKLGNIGVTMTQQMQEAELRIRKNDLISYICDDIDKLLTLSIYA